MVKIPRLHYRRSLSFGMKPEIEEFLHESLRNIGDIIEGLTKPYLKALLHQIKIMKGIKTSIKEIDSLDLGTIIRELIQTSGYAGLLGCTPKSRQ